VGESVLPRLPAAMNKRTQRKNMPETIEQRVFKVIAKSQRIALEKVTIDSSFEDLAIDSMDSINILFDLESEFDIQINDEQARQIPRVREMVEGVTLLVNAKEKASHES
jgi:acyl carrier protein